MWDKVITLSATVAAPLIGLAVRSSRRKRLREQARDYSELAATLESRNPDGARMLDDLVDETVKVLVDRERVSLQRRLDPSGIVAIVLFMVPAVVAIAWALPRDESWKWLIVGGSGLWILLCAGAGWQAIWEDPEPASENEQGSTTADTGG